MATQLQAILLFLFCTALSGCLGPVASLYPETISERPLKVFAVKRGWHTGVVLPREYIDATFILELKEFPKATHIEFSWGDEEYYQSKQPTFWIQLRAALWPTASAVQVIGLNKPPAEYFPESSVYEVAISRAGLEKMLRYFASAFERDGEGRAKYLGPGHHDQSSFYAGRNFFYVPNTCNRFTAKALRAAGCPITPFYAMRSENVFSQLEDFAVLVQ